MPAITLAITQLIATKMVNSTIPKAGICKKGIGIKERAIGKSGANIATPEFFYNEA